MSPLPVLEDLVIATPCKAPWDAMAGDDRVRFCRDCRLNVYNLSAMTRAEAEALVREKEGRLCVRFFQRPDGTVLTQYCPRPLATLRTGVNYLAGKLVALAVVLIGFALFMGSRPKAYGEESAIRQIEPFKSILEWLNPARCIQGEAPPAPPPIILMPPVAPVGPVPQRDDE